MYGLINDGRDDDAELLSFVYRCIDDLITMNDVGFLDRVYIVHRPARERELSTDIFPVRER